MEIDKLLFSARTHNALKAAGINTVEELIKYSFDDLSKLPNMGAKSMYEISRTIYLAYAGKLDQWIFGFDEKIINVEHLNLLDKLLRFGHSRDLLDALLETERKHRTR